MAGPVIADPRTGQAPIPPRKTPWGTFDKESLPPFLNKIEMARNAVMDLLGSPSNEVMLQPWMALETPLSVVSLFDGIGGARQALKNVGRPVASYSASEVDPAAMAIAKANHPDIRHIGPAETVTKRSVQGKTDLLCGGSPCQDLSRGKNLQPGKAAGRGLEGDKSSLFYQIPRVMDELQPEYWFMENVIADPREVERISRVLGVDPIRLNAKNFSAAARDRYYWTNIPIDRSRIVDAPQAARDVIRPHSDLRLLTPTQVQTALREFTPGGQTRFSKLSLGDLTRQEQIRTLRANISKGSPNNVIRWVDGQYYALTPEGAEALMGFPRGYTSTAPPTKALHALGNSWSLPVVERLLKQIR